MRCEGCCPVPTHSHLDVCPVERADGEAAVQHELHVAGAGGLVAAVREEWWGWAEVRGNKRGQVLAS